MNPIILISSCARDQKNGNQLAQGATCLRNSPLPYRFVLGQGCEVRQPDELVLDVPDDYANLPLKTREGHRWALAQGFDLIFQCFTDTFLRTDLLAETANALPASYVGNFGCMNPISRIPNKKGDFAYASGGCGYWLDREASEVLIAQAPDHWAEDLWVGNVMGRAGVSAFHDPRYRRSARPPLVNAFAVHLSQGTGCYNAQWMFRAQELAGREAILQP